MSAPAAAAVPREADVLVVGAGPAGSACAQALAHAGHDVLLVDRHAFPRDKVCGDGLIPDSHAALQRLGVQAEVAAASLAVRHVRLVGPRGGHVDVPGELAVVPRRVLDDILVRAAGRAGARMLPPLRFVAPLFDNPGSGDTAGSGSGNAGSGSGSGNANANANANANGSGSGSGSAHNAGDGRDRGAPRVVGAQLLDAASGERHAVRARWVVLATGAVPAALAAAGLCERRTPSGVALRVYVRHAALQRTLTQLHVVWHGRLRGGYGWVFPGPDGVFNVGAGLTSSHAVGADGRGHRGDGGGGGEPNLHRLLDAFAAVYPPAAELLRDGQRLGPPKGAPLRCSLAGARWSRPGLLATGEAVGSTYAFSGEGIGKALETGLLAAEAVAAGLGAAALPDAAVEARYARALRALQPRFDLYDTAGHVNRHPWLADLVVWRARRSPRLHRRLAGVLDETQDPGRLFTWRGVRKLLFE